MEKIIKKNIMNLLSAENAQRVVEVKAQSILHGRAASN